MKRINEFNKALLMKWKWRILKGEDSLWINILRERYGCLNHLFYMILVQVVAFPNHLSGKIFVPCIRVNKWLFLLVAACSLLAKELTFLLTTNWVNCRPLKEMFSALFESISLKNKSVANMGTRNSDSSDSHNLVERTQEERHLWDLLDEVPVARKVADTVS